jgi:hypothetical protein
MPAPFLPNLRVIPLIPGRMDATGRRHRHADCTAGQRITVN